MNVQEAREWVDENRPGDAHKLTLMKRLRVADDEGRLDQVKQEILGEQSERIPSLRESATKLKADVKQVNADARAEREADDSPEFTVGQAWGLFAAAIIVPGVIGLFWDPGFLGTLRVLMVVAAIYGLYAAYRDRGKAKTATSTDGVGDAVDAEGESRDRAA